MATKPLNNYDGGNFPKWIYASGTLSASTTGVVCEVRSNSARIYTFFLDATNVGTANINVNFNVYNPVTAAYIPLLQVAYYDLTQSISNFPVTFGQSSALTIRGPFERIQLVINSWGTSTGTFSGVIYAI